MQRVRNILVSTSAIQAKRLLTPLISGSIVLLLFLPILLTGSLSPRGSQLGTVLQFIFYTVSLVAVLILAGYTTYESVGSRQSGFISLVALTGLPSTHWCLACLGEIWRIFLLIWIVRAPVLAWLMTQGNFEYDKILSLELLLLCLFAWISSFALLTGSRSMTRGVTFGLVWLAYLGWEMICNLGVFVNAIFQLLRTTATCRKLKYFRLLNSFFCFSKSFITADWWICSYLSDASDRGLTCMREHLLVEIYSTNLF